MHSHGQMSASKRIGKPKSIIPPISLNPHRDGLAVHQQLFNNDLATISLSGPYLESISCHSLHQEYPGLDDDAIKHVYKSSRNSSYRKRWDPSGGDQSMRFRCDVPIVHSPI